MSYYIVGYGMAFKDSGCSWKDGRRSRLYQHVASAIADLGEVTKRGHCNVQLESHLPLDRFVQALVTNIVSRDPGFVEVVDTIFVNEHDLTFSVQNMRWNDDGTHAFRMLPKPGDAPARQ